MSRYIDADSLLTKIKAYRPYMYLGEDALSYAIKMVELEPSADVRENVRGEWIYDAEAYPLGNPYGHYDCDQCGESVPNKTNFCPNCGCSMKGEDE